MISQRLNEHWQHYTGTLGGVWEVWRGDKLQNHYNVPWQAVTLPHTYNGLDAMDPDSKYYQGEAWYRYKLQLNNPYPEGRTLLHFEGAGQRTKVYVYTEEIGEHLGGYDEFRIDITEAHALQHRVERYEGKIPLAIMCDNSRELETIPSDTSDFNLYGGIYRYLNLVYVPAISLEHVHIEVDTSGLQQAEATEQRHCRIAVRATLYNPAMKQEELELKLEIKDAAGRCVAKSTLQCKPWQQEQQLAQFELPNPQLWSPAEPALYTCSVTLKSTYGETALTERFGVRYFQFQKKGPFYLNGERLLLRGTHRHEDHAGVGAAMTEAMIREEMQLIKSMGANFIRLGHYQQSRIVLDLCDELGLLVWEEIPWCRGGLGSEQYKQQCRDMLTNMIQQHYNHPSIIIWGLGNENDWECDFDYFDEEQIRRFMKELHELAHQLDDSRLTAIRRCEFCKDIVDVYSPSIWAGWYRGIYTDYEESCKAAFENVDSFFHMEWGADNLATRHVEKVYTGFDFIAGSGASTDERDGDYLLTGGEPRVSRDGDWSETYFCEMIDWYLKCQQSMSWLTGAAQWSFKDFATPVRPDSPIPYLNMKGIVERDLTKKEAYYVFQSYWAEEPMVRIYGHTMKTRWGKPDELKQIRVYSNCEQAELFVNGQSLGVKLRSVDDFPCAGLRWEAVFRPGENHIRVLATQNSIQVEDQLSFVYQVEVWSEPVELRITTHKQEDGRIFVEAAAYDLQGVFCPDASFFVRFGLTGNGRLLDNLGTIHGSRLVQLAGGRAGIYVDPTGGRRAVISETDFVTAGGPAAAVEAAFGKQQPAVPLSIVSVIAEGMKPAYTVLC
ncbi:beta-galactosidase [Paenibacillus montaniterrae]|uniref:Beta-galactosidase n=1 Tax=Paenibacillus montaniterrae TaxID=429341 RepID=A0A919YPT6_9BACL|nr:glycoside hydrolase family 2 TIM barrel-domain containing protein [Paenibacillus montaniterrae]GIP16081.1 beta-galactosidase [Paenibacillus montaniterrae]